MAEVSEEFYTVAIALLLPLTAGLLVAQRDPYQALVIRGILGAIAALVYALFGAADVALTEALVGTMLSITLYAIAVRSSMSMRLGILDNHPLETLDAELETTTSSGKVLGSTAQPTEIEPILAALRPVLKAHYLRLEVIPYTNIQALRSALQTREVHTICLPQLELNQPQPYQLQTRLRRLYEILQAGLAADLGTLTYWLPDSQSEAKTQSDHDQPEPVEV
ncbi:MAG: DUF4040 domain-containing protein [Cyanobacteria bacterium P01_H01_bin.121]